MSLIGIVEQQRRAESAGLGKQYGPKEQSHEPWDIACHVYAMQWHGKGRTSPDSIDSSTKQLPCSSTMSHVAFPRSSTNTSPGTSLCDGTALHAHKILRRGHLPMCCEL